MDKPRIQKAGYWLAVAALLLLLIVGLGKLLGNRKTAPSKKPQNTGSVVEKISSPTPPSGSGSLRLTSTDNGFVSLGKETVLRIVGSSASPVVGYDIVLSFDPAFLSYVSAGHPLDGQYESQVRLGDGRLTVSGIVGKQSAAPAVFADTVMEEVHFKTRKAGKTMVTFVFRPDATDESNLISPESRDILAKVSPIALTVGIPLQLRLNETKQIDGTPYSLRLDRISVPPASCRDCFTSQDLTFLDASKKTETAFGFRSGGFAGTLHDEARVGGYDVKLDEATGTTVTVLVNAE